jgi:hypothetical protein
MLDSKNTIWLGSFFTLLFITFCVSRHLDDLNPHITNIQNKHDIYMADNPHKEDISNNLPIKPIKDETSAFVNEIKIEEISQLPDTNKSTKLKTLTKENNISKEILHIEKLNIDKNISTSKEKNSVLHIVKDKKTSENNKNKKTKVKKLKKTTHTYKTIDKIILSKDDIDMVLDHKENNNLNKIAFKYNIYKNTHVFIKAKEMKLAKEVKKILIRKNVKSTKINIQINDKNHNDVHILLKERN